MTADRMVGDVGTSVGLSVSGLDLTGSPQAVILVEKPNGTRATWGASVDVGAATIAHTLLEGDLTVAGPHGLVGRVTTGPKVQHTRREVLNVGAVPAEVAEGGFTPESLSNLLIRLRADRGVAGPGSNRVSSWADLSGNAHHALQAVTAKMPTLVVSALNGRPGISFNPTSGPQVLRIPTVTYGGATALTVGLVLSDTTSEVSSNIVEGAAGSGSIWMVYANTTQGWVEIRDAEATQENGGRFADSLAAPRRLIFTIDRALPGGGLLEMRAWLDGVEQALTATGNPATDNPTGAFADVALNLGARNDGSALGWTGILHDVVVYTGVKSTTEIGNLDGYLAELWDLEE